MLAPQAARSALGGSRIRGGSAAAAPRSGLRRVPLAPARAPGGSGHPDAAAPSARVAAFQGRGPNGAERLLASLPYLLPLLDTLPYGRFLFAQYPFIARALSPLAPLNSLYHAIPFGPFLVFLGVYSLIVNNQNLSRYTRYNAAQAVVLDILLIIPQLLLDTAGSMRGGGIGGLGTELYITSSNTVFLFAAVCAAYGMGACAVGQMPRLPLVADAADSQVR
ncbi:hypothetical protein Rsub_05520 [Raphidocelis subcapitata]|uniref:Protein TIC 20 n=1 Tax=Raphidocelis subcapitata TaxID=307507 RepID=A0A2V0NXF6_9CHLO|nr:hypothetical protein Rsub_05520 [Raphidocelis subcapitata]|eukprot:GBF92318.1 hypothetical protein Rsub_05520 [Raphidocelis subcapitata]